MLIFCTLAYYFALPQPQPPKNVAGEAAACSVLPVRRSRGDAMPATDEIDLIGIGPINAAAPPDLGTEKAIPSLYFPQPVAQVKRRRVTRSSAALQCRPRHDTFRGEWSTLLRPMDIIYKQGPLTGGSRSPFSALPHCALMTPSTDVARLFQARQESEQAT